MAGTVRHPQGVGVSFDSFTGNRINDSSSSRSKSITVRFQKGFKSNAKFFPSCAIDPKALTKCPASTQVGTGTAEAVVSGANGAPPTFIPATLRAYNGKAAGGGDSSLIFIAAINGKDTTELDFAVKRQVSGPYGLSFSDIRGTPGAPPPAFGIAKFSVRIPDRTVTRRVGGKRVKVHFTEAPTTCRRVWKFAQTNTYETHAPITATDEQTCTR